MSMPPLEGLDGICFYAARSKGTPTSLYSQSCDGIQAPAIVIIVILFHSSSAYDCLNVLLKKGADVNQVDSAGNSPFLAACRNGNRKCVKKLVSVSGTNISQRDLSGLSGVSEISQILDVLLVSVSHTGATATTDSLAGCWRQAWLFDRLPTVPGGHWYAGWSGSDSVTHGNQERSH